MRRQINVGFVRPERPRKKRNSERGASLVEYALLVALIAVVCIAAVTFLGTSGNEQLNRGAEAIEGTPAEEGCPPGMVAQPRPVVPGHPPEIDCLPG